MHSSRRRLTVLRRFGVLVDADRVVRRLYLPQALVARPVGDPRECVLLLPEPGEVDATPSAGPLAQGPNRYRSWSASPSRRPRATTWFDVFLQRSTSSRLYTRRSFGPRMLDKVRQSRVIMSTRSRPFRNGSSTTVRRSTSDVSSASPRAWDPNSTIRTGSTSSTIVSTIRRRRSLRAWPRAKVITLPDYVRESHSMRRSEFP